MLNKLPISAIVGPSSTWASNQRVFLSRRRLSKYLTSAVSGSSSTWVPMARSMLSDYWYRRYRALKHLGVTSKLCQSLWKCSRCFRTQVVRLWHWMVGAARPKAPGKVSTSQQDPAAVELPSCALPRPNRTAWISLVSWIGEPLSLC